MAKGRSKKKPSKTLQEYRKQRSRILHFIKRAEKRFYKFEENIVPPIPDKVSRADVNRLKKLTKEELYKSATYVSPEGKFMTGQMGRKYEARMRALTSIKNLAKAREKREKGFFKEIGLARGKSFYDTYEIINNRYGRNDALDYLKSLTDEEYKEYAEYHDLSLRIEERKSRDGIQRIDEVPDYEEGDFTNYPMAEPEDYEDSENEYGTDEEIRRENNRRDKSTEDDEKLDQKTKEWRDRYIEEKKKHPRNRKAIKDGEAILGGIYERISIFESEWEENLHDFRYKHEVNNAAKKKLLGFLQFQLNKFGEYHVCRNLDERGYEIDNAMDALLYDSDTPRPGGNKVTRALSIITAIIKGSPLTLEESMDIETYSLDISDGEGDEEE